MRKQLENEQTASICTTGKAGSTVGRSFQVRTATGLY